MTKRLVTFLSGVVLALGACAKHDTANNSAAAADTGIAADNGSVADNGAAANGTAAISPLSSQGFANSSAASDRFEIESSKLAATSASSAAVKRFATQMISAHTQSTAKLKSTAATLSPAVIPDDTLSADQQQKLDGLKGLTGPAFDSAYADAQVAAHQTTLEVLRAYAASGDTGQLKSFASGMIPTVAAHLNTAKTLK
jgi:putative membrane protein